MSISLSSLLTLSIQLSLSASLVLQSVHASRAKEGNGVLQATLKEEGEAKSVATVADVRAQRVIVAGLREAFPTIAITGEEPDDDPTIISPPTDRPSTLPPNPLDLSSLPPTLTLPLSSLRVYVDPLDGTAEFVNGTVQNSTVLIGIAVDGAPYAGVIARPFHATCPVVAAVASLSLTFGLPSLPPPSPPFRLATSSSVTSPPLVAINALLSSPPLSMSLSPRPACGTKALSLLEGECDLSVLSLKCSLWDTCATSALIIAAGGAVTDLSGSPIEYGDPERTGTDNKRGVVATMPGVVPSHGEIVAMFSGIPAVRELLEREGGGGD